MVAKGRGLINDRPTAEVAGSLPLFGICIASQIPILASKLSGKLQVPSNTDEGWLAALTGIPESLLLLLGLTCLLLGYWFLVTAIPRGRRMRVVFPTLVGSVAVGGPLWVLWLGPLILP